MKLKITLAIVLAAAIAGGLIGAAVGFAFDGDSSSGTAPAAAAPNTAAPRTSGLTAEQIYQRDAPAVVVITDTMTEQVSPSAAEKVSALGSGFVIDKEGDIVTNDHVVQGATNIRVGFSSGTTYPATVVGTDESTDIAVVRVKAPPAALHPLTFTDSAAISVGDPVYAIGNPFGLDRTMTAGIVSATGRDIQAPNGLTIANAIQTDAAINHGNSGGPLLDRFGRVVGINAQIEGGTVDGNVGVGFAIPSDTAKAVVTQLVAKGHAQHAWLGVQVETIDPSVSALVHGQLPQSGVVIARVVKGGPAAKAGLKGATHMKTVDGVSVPLGGDSIVGFDEESITSSPQLSGAVAALKPGDRVKVDVVRDGKERTVTVTLGDVPSQTS